MKLVSIIIPTNKPSTVWKPLVKCIAEQDYSRIELILLIDRSITAADFDQISRQVHALVYDTSVIFRLITPYNSSFIAGKGASYVRNYGADVATGEYVLYMDDDGMVDSDFVQDLVDCYKDTARVVGHDLILSPTIMYRDTDTIQSQGFDRVWRGICRPEPHVAGDFKSQWWKKITKYLLPQTTGDHHLHHSLHKLGCIKVKIKSSVMGLFAPREIFQVIRFDNQFEFVYEDLDFCYRAQKAGFDMIVSEDITVNHMEAARNMAQRSYLGSPRNTYYKARNRIFFIRTNAPRRGKVAFYCFGFWVQGVWFAIVVLIAGSQKLMSLWMLLKGTWDGFFRYKRR